jgi:hypothetical protein
MQVERRSQETRGDANMADDSTPIWRAFDAGLGPMCEPGPSGRATVDAAAEHGPSLQTRDDGTQRLKVL